MKNFDYTIAKDLLKKSRRVVVTSHHNPDGDAIGSALAMYHFLKPLVEEVHMIVPNDFPGFLKWMEGSDQILLYEKKVKTVKKILQDADLVFCLDYNALHRTGDMADPLEKSPAVRFLIDHHPEPDTEAFTYLYSDIKSSSTSELVYNFIKGTKPDIEISKPLAESLFVGIMTDTGSYSYACNHPEPFTITAELIRSGLDIERIHRLVYDTYSEHRLRLLGYAISEKMVVLPEYKTAFIALSREELDRYNYQVGDTEGMVNYALSMEGIIIAVLLTERKERVRLSFRSKGNFAVNRIAREHFKGGGHRNAAGGDSYKSLEDTIKELKGVLQQYKQEIDRSSY